MGDIADIFRETNPRSRRRWLSRAVELASALPLAGLWYKSVRRSRAFYTFDSSEAVVDAKKHPVIGGLMHHVDIYNTLVDILKQYKSAYFRKKVVEKGEDIETTEWFDIPKGLKHDGDLRGWEESQKPLAERINELGASKMIDGRALGLDRMRDNTAGKVALTIGVYGATIGGLLGYEEAIAKIKGQSLEEFTTPDETSRRSFLKLAGATVVAIPAFYAARGINQSDREDGAHELYATKELWIEIGEMSDADVFEHYFGVNHHTHYREMTNLREIAKDSVAALQSATGNNARTLDLYKQLHSLTDKYVQFLDTHVKTISPEIAMVCRYGLMQAAVTRDENSNSLRASFDPLIEGAMVGAGLGFFLFMGETWNRYIA